jgi:hypothetical protein
MFTRGQANAYGLLAYPHAGNKQAGHLSNKINRQLILKRIILLIVNINYGRSDE